MGNSLATRCHHMQLGLASSRQSGSACGMHEPDADAYPYCLPYVSMVRPVKAARVRRHRYRGRHRRLRLHHARGVWGRAGRCGLTALRALGARALETLSSSRAPDLRFASRSCLRSWMQMFWTHTGTKGYSRKFWHLCVQLRSTHVGTRAPCMQIRAACQRVVSTASHSCCAAGICKVASHVAPDTPSVGALECGRAITSHEPGIAQDDVEGVSTRHWSHFGTRPRQCRRVTAESMHISVIITSHSSRQRV